jgi:hypothetical protein
MPSETHRAAEGYWLPGLQQETAMDGYRARWTGLGTPFSFFFQPDGSAGPGTRMKQERRGQFRVWRLLLILGLTLAGCTSDPEAPVNQTFPIRQMDNFFENLGDQPPAPPDYEHQPGYAPAYPPY